MAATTLKTALLGEVQGKTADGVTQYLGIKYASLRDRLAVAEVTDHGNRDIVLNATTYGPTAVSPPFGCELEQSAIQHTLPRKAISQSDVSCLTLNITVPSGTTPASKLPVFIFIHGGGLVTGGTSWPQYDMARFVRLSVEKKLPIIAVSVNYRLGIFGFLTSEELRNAGYKPNNGLRDQRAAMLWVQKHIHCFGGDNQNVTLAGMSAGAVTAAVTLHLRCSDNLFSRAIAMSGSYFMTPPLSLDAHEEGYRQAMKALGLADMTPEQRLRVLLDNPAQELMSKIPPTVPIAFATDGELIPSAMTFAQTKSYGGMKPEADGACIDLMIGNAQMDASICSFSTPHWRQNAAQNLITAMYDVLAAKPAEARELLEKYSIAYDTPDDEAFSAVLNFINDVVSFAPVMSFAQGWKGNVHVYYFNEGNPWEGPWKGQPSHLLDIAYLFQNYSEYLGEQQQAVATAFAEDFFRFCYGFSPWPVVDKQGNERGFAARVYGPSDKGLSATITAQPYGGETMRRNIIFGKADKVSLDDLLMVVPKFALHASVGIQ
uniref:Carboxylic ester hydrolase n=1 Tax=Aspergillus pseudoviridinutans TaxID=1517512 RepID=A0A9P3ENT3_9EURO